MDAQQIAAVKKALAEAYANQPLFLDRLPYSPEFDQIMTIVENQFPEVTWRQGWNLLLEMRKSDRTLPRKTTRRVRVTVGKANPPKRTPLPPGPSLSEMI